MLSHTQKRYPGLRATDYDTGGMWLRRGRKKHTRPLYHKGLYISTRSNDQLGIHYKTWGPDLVRYIPGDKAVIALTDSFNYPSTRDVIAQYANLVGLYRRRGKLFLLQDTDTFTASRRVSCPKCFGKGIHWYQCNGLPVATRNQRYNSGKDIKTFSGQTIYVWRCNCLDDNPNLDPKNHRAKVSCSFCSGNGYRTLGNKRISYEWNGDPLIIDLTTGRIQYVYKTTNEIKEV